MINPQHDLENPSGDERTQYLFEKLSPFQNQRSYPRNTLVISAGTVSSKLVFVQDGILRTYRLNPDYEEITSGFAFPGDFDLVSHSFFGRAVADENIVALTDVQLLVWRYEDIIPILSTDPMLAQIVFGFLSQYIETVEMRLFDMREKNAAQHYEKLRTMVPKEIARIPDRYIASYLGITKERMSRIKNQR